MSTSGNRYVILIHGILSSRRKFQPDSRGRDDFSYVRETLTGVIPEDHFINFSYRAGRAGREAWAGDYLRGAEPDYDPWDTTDWTLDEHAKALGWLIRNLVDRVQKEEGVVPVVDLIGFSLGGIVALQWAASVHPWSPLLKQVHSIISLDSPVLGLNPLALRLPVSIRVLSTMTGAVGWSNVARVAAARENRHRRIFQHRLGIASTTEEKQTLQDPDADPTEIAEGIERALVNVASKVDILCISNRQDYAINGKRVSRTMGWLLRRCGKRLPTWIAEKLEVLGGWIGRGAACWSDSVERIPCVVSSMGKKEGVKIPWWPGRPKYIDVPFVPFIKVNETHGIILCEDDSYSRELAVARKKMRCAVCGDGPVWSGRHTDPVSPDRVGALSSRIRRLSRQPSGAPQQVPGGNGPDPVRASRRNG